MQGININLPNSVELRDIDFEEVNVSGTTDSGVKSVSLLFRGKNGTLNGVNVPNNFAIDYTPSVGSEFVDAIAYTAPTTGEQRILISYIR